ncbi:MAG: hypothetical protein ABIL58_14020 [Pseudomonadota bacterium]
MHNLTGKICPLINQQCLLTGCTMFNERLENCEVSLLTFNLYQLKEHIRAQLNRNTGVPDGIPMSEMEPTKGPRYPRPSR